MATPSQNWAVRISGIQECRALSQRETKFVAHMPLMLPTEAWNYIESLDFEKDFEPKKNLTSPWNGHKSHKLESGKWHHQPSASVTAKQDFQRAANLFFPARPGRAILVASLSELMADYAAAINRAHLHIDFRAFGNAHWRPELGLHYDGPDDLTAGFYLRGKTTVHVSPAADEQLVRISPGEVPVEYQFNPAMLETLRCVPQRSFSMWPTTQRHSDPVAHNSGTRIALFVFAHRSQPEPAL